MRGRGKGNDGPAKKGRLRSPLVQRTGADVEPAAEPVVENPAGTLGNVHIGKKPVKPSANKKDAPIIIPEKSLPEFKAPKPEPEITKTPGIASTSSNGSTRNSADNPFAKRARQVLSAYDPNLPLEENVQRPGFDLAFADVLKDKGVTGWNEFVEQLTIDRARSGTWLGPNISGFAFTKIPLEVWEEARTSNVKINLRGANVDGCDLTGLTPEQLNLLDLSRGYWHNTRLDNLDLRQWANLDNQVFQNCSFKGCDISGRNWKLSNDELKGNDLSEANLVGTTIEAGNMAKLVEWKFNETKLDRATLKGFSLEKSEFTNVLARSSNWDAEVKECTFNDCDLSDSTSNAEQDYKKKPYWWDSNKLTRTRLDHFQAGALLWHNNHFVDSSIRGMGVGWANLVPESRSQTMNGTSGNWLTNNTFENSVMTFTPESFKILPYKGPVVCAHNKLLGSGAFGGEGLAEFKGWSFWTNDWSAGRLQNATFLDCKWGEADRVDINKVHNVVIAPDCKVDKGALKDNNTGTMLPIGEKIGAGKVTSVAAKNIAPPVVDSKASFWKKIFGR